MKESPLHNKHLALNALMIEFGGWNMPVQYETGIMAEHEHTRSKASIFDISHMGEFRVTGATAGKELDYVFGRQVSDLKEGSCRYNFLLTENGGVIDDLIVYKITPNEFYIVVNAANIAIDYNKIKQRLVTAQIADESETTAKIDLQGPESIKVLERLGINKEDLPKYFTSKLINLKGNKVFISRTGYTGELGFELYLPTQQCEWLWDLLLSTTNVKPAGLGARDTLRIEMGYALYGHELSLTVNPKEIGFGTTLKQRSFIENSILEKELTKKLVAIVLDTRRIARQNTKVYTIAEREIGWVTSGTFSPSLKKSIAMAFINIEFSSKFVGEVLLGKAPKYLKGTIVDLPFYKNGTVKNKA